MRFKEKLIIVGAGGHGRVVAEIAKKSERYSAVEFLDDDKISIDGYQIIGNRLDANKYIAEYDIFIAIGSNQARQQVQEQLAEKGASIPILIHPSAIIGEHVSFGAGTVIMAGVIINCGTMIGKGCIINTGAAVDHDNWLEDYVHISPGVNVAGTVHIGKGTWIGIGATVSNNINICGGCVVGAGAVVVKDISKAGTYVGIPAKEMGAIKALKNRG